MPLRSLCFLVAATTALTVAAGCDAKPDAAATDPAPVAHTQIRTGVKGKPAARGVGRPHKAPMQTGPAQTTTANDL